MSGDPDQLLDGALFKSAREEIVARLGLAGLGSSLPPAGPDGRGQGAGCGVVTIFRDQKVHREGLAAVRLFRETAERERITVELARWQAEYLRWAR